MGTDHVPYLSFYGTGRTISDHLHVCFASLCYNGVVLFSHCPNQLILQRNVGLHWIHILFANFGAWATPHSGTPRTYQLTHSHLLLMVFLGGAVCERNQICFNQDVCNPSTFACASNSSGFHALFIKLYGGKKADKILFLITKLGPTFYGQLYKFMLLIPF